MCGGVVVDVLMEQLLGSWMFLLGVGVKLGMRHTPWVTLSQHRQTCGAGGGGVVYFWTQLLHLKAQIP